jgi:hypothetical protein
MTEDLEYRVFTVTASGGLVPPGDDQGVPRCDGPAEARS